MGRLLFLLGGSEEIFDLVAEQFVPAAGGSQARIALLLMGGEGWERHLPGYVAPWERRGAAWEVVVPGADGALDVEAARAQLEQASGIFIGGGHSPTYHRLYATEPMRSLIRRRYRQGVPVAGLSAGALIIPERCLMVGRAPGDPPLSRRRGLGLVRGMVVGVHFQEEARLAPLLQAMARTRTAQGLGIGESACAVLENERLRRVLGRPLYQVTMTDFDSGSYAIKDVTSPA